VYKFFSLLIILLTVPSQAQPTDPTRPLQYTESQSSAVKKQQGQLVLQSIIGQGNNKSVVISGKFLTLGKRIGTYQLAEIGGNFVVLSSAEKDIKLSLFSSVVAKSK